MSSSDGGTDFDSTSDVSSGANDHTDIPVGLSDPQYVAKKRKMLDAVNRLRATGAQLDLDIPIIAVLGSQSAGKSSLIEAISGITLPRASGTCTRCPTECQLSHSSEPWRCVVSLRRVTDAEGKALSQPQKIDFGDAIFEKPLVTERIRRAQCAILNPGTSPEKFLEASDDVLEERQLSFSSNTICLEIYGRDVDDLSFVDLPGLIVGGEPRDSRLVQQLAEEHISKESCIILLTITCETDFENQTAHRLAAQFDPSGARTIGVLTKPDRIPAGEEALWIGKIRSGGVDGGVEYFSVKNPDSQDIKNGITYEQARENEAEFFSNREPWSSLEWLCQRRLGTDKLTKRLGQVLSSLISKRLPELQEELDRLLEQTQQEIGQLPSPPSSEPVSEILKMINVFVQSIQRLVEGVPDEDGLLQTLREPRDEFKGEIRRTAPYFLPLENFSNGNNLSLAVRSHRPGPRIVPRVPPFSFLSSEETWEQEPCNASSPIFIDDVLKKANSAVTRELPGYYPYIVIKQYIVDFVERWEDPSRRFFDTTQKELTSDVQLLVEKYFSQYTHGHLKQGVRSIMQSHIQKCADTAAQQIGFLLADEHEPFTLNTHYYTEYRSKFLGHYKRHRLISTSDSRIIRNLDPDTCSPSMKATLDEAISSLTRLGLQSASLATLLPPDSMEPAITIMADVRAYFQVAYKRFVDNIPMCIDRTLLRGVTVGLEDALFDGLGINGPGGYERCRKLLSEPGDVVERRSELEKRRQRLLLARKELTELFE
ncbi:P-loop containing nucleoside triphosphate hydrolase protein [Lactarius deliciosus]|nr:P-loop containing nucleoside triphosphate hydrolase protein [Lactarius deliciosus]